jgi:flagellar assembly protein FliH
MTDKALPAKEEKYFFNANIFDEDRIDDANAEPPPPVFSEAELDAAKQKSLQEGRRVAAEEAKASREQFIAQLLQKIEQDLPTLFAAEQKRERTYEQEAVRLTLYLFEKLFPLYNEKQGFAELKDAMTHVLRRQENQKQITVVVAPSCAKEIEKHIATLGFSAPGREFTVKGDETLAEGAFRLSWSDGGAVRDSEALAEEIKASLQQVLAGDAAKGHDKTGKMEKPDG